MTGSTMASKRLGSGQSRKNGQKGPASRAIESLESRRLLSAVLSTITDLGTLGGNSSLGESVNASGDVAGESLTTNDGVAYNAFLYNGTSLMNLGTLGGSTSFSSAINNNGQIVGYSRISSGVNNAFLYTGGALQNLGAFAGGTSLAYGISPTGEIVGYSTQSNGSERAVFR